METKSEEQKDKLELMKSQLKDLVEKNLLLVEAIPKVLTELRESTRSYADEERNMEYRLKRYREENSIHIYRKTDEGRFDDGVETEMVEGLNLCREMSPIVTETFRDIYKYCMLEMLKDENRNNLGGLIQIVQKAIDKIRPKTERIGALGSLIETATKLLMKSKETKQEDNVYE